MEPRRVSLPKGTSDHARPAATSQAPCGRRGCSPTSTLFIDVDAGEKINKKPRVDCDLRVSPHPQHSAPAEIRH